MTSDKVTVLRKFNPEDTSKPILWAARVCPYAERSVIALEEMGVEYERIEVDLQNKPASLFEVNKKGLVPAMKDQGNCITDSYNILQYIDEMWGRSDNKTLLPVKPVDRATARNWCEYINNNLVKFFYEAVLKPTTEEQEAAKAKLLESIKIVSDAMKSLSNGPFFMGSEFSVVDIMLTPHVERFLALVLYRDFKIPKTAEYERFNNWWKAVQQRPSFQCAKAPESLIIDSFKKYASGEIKSKVQEAIRKGEALP